MPGRYHKVGFKERSGEYSNTVGKGRSFIENHVRQILPFFRRHLQGALALRQKVRVDEETLHLALAGLVGIIGGLYTYIFSSLIRAFMSITLRHVGETVEVAEMLDPWERLLVPVFGGLAAGLILYWGLRLVGNQGANNILEVVVAGDGRLRMRSALVKAASSVVSIATGASIGREGSIAQMTATLSSKLGQIAEWPPYRLRLLVACGTASGISAAYNAPVAGAIFAAQIVLGNFAMNLFAPIVLASVVATMVSRYFFGLKPFYEVPPYDFTRLMQLPWFLILGLFSGLLAAGFLKLLHKSEEFFAQLKAPIYCRLPIAGLIVGILAIWLPQVWGNGYGAINSILHHEPSLVFLVGLFVAKLIATLVTVGAGTVGGVFTPTLFLGAALGSLFGTFLHEFNMTQLPTGAFALVGMGSVLAGTIHAPLLAMIMIFEISLNYSVMPPLMLACIISSLVARQLHPDSIYTAPLRRKGLSTNRELERIGEATQASVGELMRERVPPLRENAAFRQIADRFLTSSNNFLPVVDETDRFLGVVALQDLKEYLNGSHQFNGIIALDVMRPPPAALTPNQKIIDALPVLLASDLRNVPVVNNVADFRLIGAVTRAEALSLLSEALAAKHGV
jgi:CIC family chloride channel protein